MENEILSYLGMCQREGSSLQKGMNFRLGGDHSVILMSLRPGAPYRDHVEEGGETLIYEGHDVPKTKVVIDPKRIDQPEYTAGGGLTENGKFHQAAQAAKSGRSPPERVRVYEKIQKGIWSYNGVFHLVDSWREHDGHREVFKFKLVAVKGDEDFSRPVRTDVEHRRIIPTWVKLEVWKRDKGKCVQCGATDELHYDHILPYSKGGTSITPENVQLLCARHNLQKGAKIL
ncbi:MAG TPA: HNH endonuclease [Gammaproteobacteria bacterium]|nr:HNH endonuclease [Gammaproteobacteria bacterium]